MLSLLKRLMGKTYRPLNTVCLSQEALIYNYRYLQKLSGKSIAPVLKSNAYGHGIIEVAKILQKENPPFFCVDSIFEAYQLLKAGIKTQILIMGYINPENLKVKKLPFSYAVYSKEIISVISRHQPSAKCHLFVDTGMHREGVILADLPDLLGYADNLGVKIKGLMSHFAMGDKPEDEDTKNQVQNFKKAVNILNEKGVYPEWVHISASTGILLSEHYGKIGNIGRGGISLYGISPITNIENGLKPVLSLRSTIVQIKNLKKGEKSGYDFTFTAEKDMKIAILPIGYNDGVDRRLSNKGVVQIKDKYCPIIGRVSMNITVIDVSDLPDAKVGDEVIVYSGNKSDNNSIENSAKICETIPYELLVHVNSGSKRILTK